MSTYYKLGSLVEGLTSTATAAGTTTLTASSRPIQQFTGTTTQTVVLPDATTLSIGRRFDINNRSTGAITVNANGGGAVGVVAAGTQRYFLVSDISLAAGVWRVGGVTGSGGGGVTDADKLKLLQGMAGLNLQTDNIVAKVIKTNPEEVGGNFWITKSPGTPIGYGGFFSASGFYYQSTGLNSASVETGITSRYSDDDNYWLARTSAPSARYGAICFSLTDNYVVGGNNVNPVTSNQSFNVLTNAWTSNLALPVATDFGGGFALNGYGFIVGGRTTNSLIGVNAVYQYDSVLNSWTLRSPTLATASQRSYTQTADLGGFGYSVGGSDAGNTTNTSIVNVYDIATNSWSTAPSMITTRSFFGISNNVVGSIMAFAGSVPSNSNLSEQFFDTTKTWKATATLGTAKNSVAGGSLNGSAMCVGSSVFAAVVESFIPASFFNLGSVKVSTTAPTSILAAVLMSDLAYSVPVQIRTDGDSWKTFTSGGSVLKTGETLSAKFQHSPASGMVVGGASTTSESYGKSQNAWTTRASIPANRGQYYGFSLNDRLYIVGGTGGVSSGLRFDEIKNTFTTLSSSLLSGKMNGAGALLNGFGYVTGGAATSTTTGFTAHDRYNDTLDSWLARTGLTAGKTYVGGTAAEGRIFVYTGYSTGTRTSSGEGYSDSTDSWSAIAAYGLGIIAEMPTMSIGGYAYGCGGYNGSNVSSVYRYTPSTNIWAARTNLNTAKYSAVTFVLEGFGYVANGFVAGNSNALEEHNPDANTWTNRQTSTFSKSELSYSQTHTTPYRNYEMRVGIPAFYAGVGGGVWVTKTTNPSNNTFSAAGTSGSTVFLSCSASSASYAYDYLSDSYVRIQDYPQSPQGQQNCSISTTVGDIIYSTGGPTASAAPVFALSPYTRVYTTLANMPVYTNSGCFSALNGMMYYIGGNPGGLGASTRTQKYNPTTNAWTDHGNLLPSSGVYNIGGAYNGFIYVTGGNNSTNNYQFNDASVAFTSKTGPTASVALGLAAVVNGEYFTSMGFGPLTAASQSYRDSANVWATKTSAPSAFQDTQGGTVGDTAFFSGGYNAGGFGTSHAYVSSIKQAVLGIALEVK